MALQAHLDLAVLELPTQHCSFCLHQQQGKPVLGAAVGLLVCWQATSFRCPCVAYGLFIMDKIAIFT